MGRRSDAEAANRQIDDHLYLRRARSLGARRQLFDLLAYALVQNSIAVAARRAFIDGIEPQKRDRNLV